MFLVILCAGNVSPFFIVNWLKNKSHNFITILCKFCFHPIIFKTNKNQYRSFQSSEVNECWLARKIDMSNLIRDLEYWLSNDCNFFSLFEIKKIVFPQKFQFQRVYFLLYWYLENKAKSGCIRCYVYSRIYINLNLLGQPYLDKSKNNNNIEFS